MFSFEMDCDIQEVGGGFPFQVRHEIEADHIDVVMEQFERFLLGCGFVFDGHLGLVEE
jgi:hypothetical protein